MRTRRRRPAGTLRVAVAAVAGLLATAGATRVARAGGWDPCEPRRGPVDVRDGQVFAQPRLTLGAVSPDTVGAGRSTLEAHLVLSTTFAGDLSGQGEDPASRDPLADSEGHTLALTWTRGVRDDLDVGVRLAVHDRGGGVFDPVIDAFHRATGAGETDFHHGRYEVSGIDDAGRRFDWEERGAGLGDVEVQAKWRFADGGRDGWSAALSGRVTWPTGTGPFAVGGVGAGVQAAVAKRLGHRFDAFGGVGVTAWTRDEVDGIAYETWRGAAFLAIEWRVGPCVSVIGEVETASPLVTNVGRFADPRAYWGVSARIDLSASTEVHFGFVENEVWFGSSQDVALHAGLTWKF